jgi:hypothetical protein
LGCRRNSSTQSGTGVSKRIWDEEAGASDAMVAEPRPDGKVWIMAQGTQEGPEAWVQVGRRLHMGRIAVAPIR